MIDRGTRVTSKSGLASLLMRWYEQTIEPTIGTALRYRGEPWIRIDLRPYPARLNADTSREAVRVYLDDVAARGAEVSWQVVANGRGRINKVVYSNNSIGGRGWYCYLYHELTEPCEL